MGKKCRKTLSGICNIAYLHNKTAISGGERSLLNLLENLERDRFRPYLVIPGEGEVAGEAKRLGIDVLFLRVPPLNFGNSFNILKALFVLGWYVRENRIDIIHSYTPRNNILGAFAGKIFRVPVVWHERNLLFGDEIDVTRNFLFLPDRIICNSRAIAERFEKGGRVPSKVRVILNGVDLKRFNPATSGEKVKRQLRLGDRRVVGIITNLGRRKRVEYFLEAASLILRKSKNVFFLVVGGEFPDKTGGRLDELKERADGLGLSGHIVFTGFRKDITEFLASFDISTHVTIKEACSRAIIESMAAGKPVIAMNDGGNPELVENGVSGILIDPYDIEGFVEAVMDLLANDTKREEMGRKARARAERLFEVKRNARETEQVYAELVTCLTE